MQNQPRVSVVITLFNKVKYIERAVASVLRQSWGECEIIVVDDGSTDGGGDILARIPDPRLRVIRQNNQGEGVARNRGIRESRGALIAMLDADDEWEPGFLEAVMALADRYPEAGILATGYRTIYRGGLVVETSLAQPPGDHCLLVTDYFRRARIAGFVWSSAQAIRRAVYEDVGLFPEREPMGPDLDMWGRIALKYPVAYDCRILASYRNDATGRVVTAWRKKPTFPPFIRTARAVIQRGQVNSEVAADLREYVNRLLLQYLDRVIAARDRAELRRSLREEFYPTYAFTGELLFLRFTASILPMRMLYFLRRIWLSRIRLILRRHYVNNGVVVRLRSVACPPAVPMA